MIISIRSRLLGLVAAYVLFLVAIVNAQSQTVSVPDSNLRKAILRLNSRAIVANQLVLSEVPNIKGTLKCTNQHTLNAEGIQYLTSLSTIDLSNSQLVSLPRLQSDSLKGLYLTKNFLTTLPDLSLLPNLVYLDVVDNAITALMGVDKLKKLQSLLAKGNQISYVPPLDSLKSLVGLDLSYNLLTAFPSLPNTKKITALHLNNNHLKALPSNFLLASSARMFIYSNDLTFTELLKIKTIPNYDSVVSYWMQNSIPMKDVIVKEIDTLSLSSNTDIGVSGMKYTWYKDGNLVAEGTSDKFVVPSSAFKDSGKYVCQLTNDQLAVELWTDTFNVSVHVCLVPNQFTVTSTPIACKKSGALQIVAPTKEALNYYLKGKTTGREYQSSNGSFIGLSEPVFTLKMVNKRGCTKDYPTEIRLEKEECQKALVTPNGDGESDSYFFTKSGTVSIHDKNGTLIKTLSIPNEWDGTAKSGRVAPGLYLADINNGEELINISVVY